MPVVGGRVLEVPVAHPDGVAQRISSGGAGYHFNEVTAGRGPRICTQLELVAGCPVRRVPLE